MAGIRLFGNGVPDNDSGLAPGQLPGEKFSVYLARVHASWLRNATRTASRFAAVTLNPLHTAHADISGNLIDWLDRFTGEVDAASKGKAVIAKLDLEGAAPIRVQPGHITNHTKDKVTPHTALAMATLAMADPKMKKKGVYLEGSDEEKMLLLHALKEIGFKGKIHNKPNDKLPEYEKAMQAITDALPAFLAHVGQKTPPGTPPSPPPPPPGTPPVGRNFTANAAQPVGMGTFDQTAGDLMMNIYGQQFSAGQHAAYSAARIEAAKEQAAELVAKKAMTQEEAEALVADPARSMPEGVTPFAALLMPKLPQGFFPKDMKTDALRLQTAGRILGVLQGDIDPGLIASPNIFDGDPDDLKELQRDLKTVLDSFPAPPPNARKAQIGAFDALHRLHGNALAARNRQAAAVIGQMIQLFDQSGQKPHAAGQPVLTTPKNPS